MPVSYLRKFVERTAREHKMHIDSYDPALMRDTWMFNQMTNQAWKDKIQAQLTKDNLFDVLMADFIENGPSEPDIDLYHRTQNLKEHLK